MEETSLSTQDIFYVVNVEAVVADGERYLMVVRSLSEDHAPGGLTLPGGKVEHAGISSQILEETARREVLEETGVEVEPGPVYLWSSSFIADNDWPVVDVVFLCLYQRGEATTRQPDEVAAVHWMTAAQIFGTPGLAPWTKHSIELAEARRITEQQPGTTPREEPRRRKKDFHQ